MILPKELAKMLPKGKLLSDAEWRAYGVQQSRGWEHYAVHKPEPHILLFRRPLGTDPTTGRVSPLLFAPLTLPSSGLSGLGQHGQHVLLR